MIRMMVGLLFTASAGFFGLLFYERYWRWHDCFNELGRCFDPESQDVILVSRLRITDQFASLSHGYSETKGH